MFTDAYAHVYIIRAWTKMNVHVHVHLKIYVHIMSHLHSLHDVLWVPEGVVKLTCIPLKESNQQNHHHRSTYDRVSAAFCESSGLHSLRSLNPCIRRDHFTIQTCARMLCNRVTMTMRVCVCRQMFVKKSNGGSGRKPCARQRFWLVVQESSEDCFCWKSDWSHKLVIWRPRHGWKGLI
jgi:hypothetical protein